MLTHKADGALRILKGGGRFGIRAGVGNAVLEKYAGNTGGVEPVADFRAFEVDGKDVIPAAWKNNDGRRRNAGACRFVERDGWDRNIAEVDERFSGDERVLSLRKIGFCERVGGCIWHAVRPDRNLRVAGRGLPPGLLRVKRDDGESESEQCDRASEHDRNLRNLVGAMIALEGRMLQRGSALEGAKAGRAEG